MSPIVDTRRLLNGFSFTPEPSAGSCYVLGCCNAPIVGRLHRRFGAVSGCADHDPDRHGYAIGFGTPAPEPIAPIAPIDPPPVSGGQKTAVRQPIPRRPSPSAAVQPF